LPRHYTLDPYLEQLGGTQSAFAPLGSDIVEHMEPAFEWDEPERSLVKSYLEHNKPAFAVLDYPDKENPEYNA
jgi:hypothetical protein